jgi:hypothetical protein
MLNGLSKSVAIGGHPQSGGLDQLPQHLPQVRRLIERMPAGKRPRIAWQFESSKPGFQVSGKVVNAGRARAI